MCFYYLYTAMRKPRHREGRSPSEVVHTVDRKLSWESMWAVWLQSSAPQPRPPAGGQTVAQRTVKGQVGWGQGGYKHRGAGFIAS